MALSNRNRKWLRGGIEVLIHGGTAAIIAAIIQHQTDHKDIFFFGISFWTAVWMQFIGSGLLRLVQWLHNNPLPAEGDTNMMDSKGKMMLAPTQISLNPLNQVQSVPKP